jgi:hypothetical protein
MKEDLDALDVKYKIVDLEEMKRLAYNRFMLKCITFC